MKCNTCGMRRAIRHYICRSCWDKLPDKTRQELDGRHDESVVPVLRALFSSPHTASSAAQHPRGGGGRA